MDDANVRSAADLYDELDRRMIAAILESKASGGSRVEQLIELARLLGVMRIGIAHCVGFAEPAERLAKYHEEPLEVVTADSTVGGPQAEEIVPDATGALCNPAGQADALNMAGTDLNISVGLCLGHDMIFQKHSIAPVTVFAVKDRATNHQPLAALK